MKTTHEHSCAPPAAGGAIIYIAAAEFCGEIGRQNEAVSTVDWARRVWPLANAQLNW